MCLPIILFIISPIKRFFEENSGQEGNEDYDRSLHNLEETERQKAETKHLQKTVCNA